MRYSVQNFNAAATFLNYINRIVIPGRTFGYGADGVPFGMVDKNKRIVILAGSGSAYNVLTQYDQNCHEHYVTTVFPFIGIQNVHIVSSNYRTPDDMDEALQTAQQEIAALIGGI